MLPYPNSAAKVAAHEPAEHFAKVSTKDSQQGARSPFESLTYRFRRYARHAVNHVDEVQNERDGVKRDSGVLPVALKV